KTGRHRNARRGVGRRHRRTAPARGHAHAPRPRALRAARPAREPSHRARHARALARLARRRQPLEARVEHQGAQHQDGLSRGKRAEGRFGSGIGVGTTNSAVALADLLEQTASGTPRVRIFQIPQLVAEGETAPRETLPSFLYFLGAEERASRRFGPPWAPDAPHVAGVWARDQGALVPGRLVSSAKS